MAALTGQLLADFSDFTRAVDAAKVSLQGFESGAGQVKTSLDAMVDQFSGRQVVQDAALMVEAIERIGGASKLTKDELDRVSGKAKEAGDKLRALGQDVPAGIDEIARASKDAGEKTGFWNSALSTLSGTFGALTLQRVIDEAIQFGKEIFTTASQLENLHDKTNISVEALQGFKVVGDQTGVSLDTIANAAVHLQRALGEGEAATGGQLEQIGLHFKDIKDLSMEDAFLAVAKALKDTDDQTKALAVGSGLMGKSFAESLPAIKKGFGETKDSATTWSASTVQALDTAQNNAAGFVAYMKAGFGQVIADVLTGTTEGFRRIKDSIDALVQGTLAKAPANFWGQILPPSLPKDLDEIIGKSDAWAQETKAVQGAMVELDSAGKGWQGTLNTINGDVVEAIKWYLEAGVSQNALAIAFGLTAVQVKAVDSAMKDGMATQKVWTDFEKESHKLFLDHWKEEEDAKKKQTAAVNKDVIDGNAQIMAAEAELRDLKMKDSLDTTSYQILKIWEKADAEIAAFKGTKEQAERHKAAVTQLAEEQVNAIQYAAETSIDHVAKHGVEVVGAAASQLQSLVGGIKMPGMGIESAGGLKYLTLPNGTRVEIGPHGELPDNIDDLIMGRTGMSSGYGNQPRIGTGYDARAEGGSVTSGTPYLVGERGPELFVPTASGAIVPNGGGGGVTQNVVIHVNGTAADVARQVAAELMRTLRSGQQLPLR